MAMLTILQQSEAIRKELVNCSNPLFFLDDDPDGLCSYLLLKRFKGSGKGILIKSTPRITEEHLKKIEEYSPDKVFILDIAAVEKEFLSKTEVPVVWVDHHEPAKPEGAIYINSNLSVEGENKPTSYLCYKAVNQDLWLGTIGVIADWHFPEYAREFSKKHPKVLPPAVKGVEEALFNSPLGELVNALSFVMKGKTEDSKKSISALSKIDSPEEILFQTTPAGKFIWKRYKYFDEKFQCQLSEARKKASEEKFLIFLYKGSISFTKDISNRLLYEYNDKIILVGREKGDEIKLSLRASQPIRDSLKSALHNVGGIGGGHEMACGAVIKRKDFEKFLENFKKSFTA